MKSFFHFSKAETLLNWARAQSLWYYSAGSGCCVDEVMNAFGCRYDLERFGAVPQTDPMEADLLIVSGAVSLKLSSHLLELYDKMPEPKYVMAIGACACTGGPYGPDTSYSVVPGLERIIQVDVFVPGCPPRPEAIMNGLLMLQEKILGSKKHKELN